MVVNIIITCRVIGECILSFPTFWNLYNISLWPKILSLFVDNQWVLEQVMFCPHFQDIDLDIYYWMFVSYAI